jgi:HPt (histidine-containing phosphotransfer) domain-containing protein
LKNFEPNNKNILAPAEEQLYDLSMLEEMDDNRYVAEVLNIFLRDTPVDLKEMNDAFNAGNTATIAQKAHKIKGSAGVIQAGELCSLLKEIEKITRAGIINDVLKKLMESTLQLYNIIECALHKHIQQLK